VVEAQVQLESPHQEEAEVVEELTQKTQSLLLLLLISLLMSVPQELETVETVEILILMILLRSWLKEEAVLLVPAQALEEKPVLQSELLNLTVETVELEEPPSEVEVEAEVLETLKLVPTEQLHHL